MRRKLIKQEVSDVKKAYIKQSKQLGSLEDPKEFTKKRDLMQNIRKYLAQLLGL